MKTILCTLSTCCALLWAGKSSVAAATYTIDPGAAWSGYMNVFELPANGGGFLWGSGWGPADLRANFSGPTLTLAPNTIGDASTYWYIGGGGPGAAGNKIMDANFYQEFNGGLLGGQTVTFTGNVLLNSLTSAHTVTAFIKDFAPDYSTSVATTLALTPGVFSISLNTINDPARHVQFGFTMNGVNVWATDVAPYGQVDITAVVVPEPATAALLLGGFAGLLFVRRSKGQIQN